MTEQSGGRIDAGRPGVDFLQIRRKKRQNPPARPEMVFFEMIEMIEVRKRPKAPVFVVNLAIVAVIVAFIWVMNRS